jgi:hypothetical protein
MKATQIRPSNKNQWQEAQADPKQKHDRAQDSAWTAFNPYPAINLFQLDLIKISILDVKQN